MIGDLLVAPADAVIRSREDIIGVPGELGADTAAQEIAPALPAIEEDLLNQA